MLDFNIKNIRGLKGHLKVQHQYNYFGTDFVFWIVREACYSLFKESVWLREDMRKYVLSINKNNDYEINDQRLQSAQECEVTTKAIQFIQTHANLCE